MTSPLSRRLREEARQLRRTAKVVWEESETLLARATTLNRRATELEERADELDDLDEVAALTGAENRVRAHVGPVVRVSRGRKVA